VHAQVTEQQIHTWIKALSVKKDLRGNNINLVFQGIENSDSATLCSTIGRFTTSAEDANIRGQIRAKIILHLLESPKRNCQYIRPAVDLLRGALQSAYEIEDEALQYEVHLRLGQVYNAMRHYGLASMHYHMLFDILRRNDPAKFHLSSSIFYDMSFSLYHTHEYPASIKSGLNAMSALKDAQFQPDDSLNSYQQMLQWNTIGLAYHKIQKYDSAFLAFTNAQKVAEKTSNSFWIGIINGNKGDVYYEQGKYDSAYVLLQDDYNRSIADKQFDNAANSLQWIARIDLHNGNSNGALQKLRKARRLLYEKPEPVYLANVNFAFSQVYAALGRADSVNTYLQQYLHLHDSLQTEISNNRTDILQMRMNNLDQIQTIKILNRQKQQIALTRNFTIVVVILIGLIAYLLLSRILQKMQVRQKEMLKGKQIAEAQAQTAIQQIEIFRQNLLEKNAQIEQLLSTNETKENSEDEIRRISELTHHLILKEEDWVQFKALFDSVYPGFFLSLRHKVPDITQAEQRMAAFSKLKLTAKEAANLLGVSPNTVYTTRRRLRQRLGLDEDSALESYFE
jgi:DNA-binding CsgD family transcriptional regulator/tetratricopeptide (TPR) repeat protein